MLKSIEKGLNSRPELAICPTEQFPSGPPWPGYTRHLEHMPLYFLLVDSVSPTFNCIRSSGPRYNCYGGAESHFLS